MSRFTAAMVQLSGLAMVAAACTTSDGTGPSPIVRTPVTITPADQWSGGTIQLHSAAFQNVPDSGFTVFAGTTVLVHHRDSDSTASVILPAAPSGPLEIRISSGGDTVSVGSVNVVGYAGIRVASEQINDGFNTWDRGSPAVLGIAYLGPDTGSGLPPQAVATLDLKSGQVTKYAETASNGLSDYGAAPSFHTDEVTIANGATTTVWRLGSTAESLGVVLIPDTRYLVRFADSTWFWTDNHHGYGANTVTGHNSPMVGLESSWGWVFSPDRTMVIPLVDATDSGAVVLSAATGAVLRDVPSVSSVTAAAFSPDGAHVFVGGQPRTGGPLLTAVDRATGTVIGVDSSFAAADAGPIGMAVDSAGGRLFVAVNAGSAGHVELRVYDASTLALIATLDPPTEAPTCGACWIAPTVFSSSEHRVYVVPQLIHPLADMTPTPIYMFDVLPSVTP